MLRSSEAAAPQRRCELASIKRGPFWARGLLPLRGSSSPRTKKQNAKHFGPSEARPGGPGGLRPPGRGCGGEAPARNAKHCSQPKAARKAEGFAPQRRSELASFKRGRFDAKRGGPLRGKPPLCAAKHFAKQNTRGRSPRKLGRKILLVQKMVVQVQNKNGGTNPKMVVQISVDEQISDVKYLLHELHKFSKIPEKCEKPVLAPKKYTI